MLSLANGSASHFSLDVGVLEQVLILSTTAHNPIKLSCALVDSAQYKLDKTPTNQI